MLKGVNKQVVEVVEVDNEFFERAILFVKPEKQQNGEEALREFAAVAAPAARRLAAVGRPAGPMGQRRGAGGPAGRTSDKIGSIFAKGCVIIVPFIGMHSAQRGNRPPPAGPYRTGGPQP